VPRLGRAEPAAIRSASEAVRRQVDAADLLGLVVGDGDRLAGWANGERRPERALFGRRKRHRGPERLAGMSRRGLQRSGVASHWLRRALGPGEHLAEMILDTVATLVLDALQMAWRSRAGAKSRG
jgi:hypothetical protein